MPRDKRRRHCIESRALALAALALFLAAGPAVADESALKLYVFDCGRLLMASMAGFSVADDETDVRELSVPCYVVEHPKGRLLWDGGLASSVANTEGWHGEGMRMKLDRPLAEQLAALNLGMSSFDFVAFSHMHFDHVGVANEVRGATLLIQKAEYEAAFADPVTVRGFDPESYSGLRDLETKILDGDHDVFGDGKVRILSTPGHTPGHQSLLVELGETGAVVLSGDLYHTRISREDRRIPVFNFDREATLESMGRIEALVRDKKAQLWIEHELALFEQLDKPPKFYD